MQGKKSKLFAAVGALCGGLAGTTAHGSIVVSQFDYTAVPTSMAVNSGKTLVANSTVNGGGTFTSSYSTADGPSTGNDGFGPSLAQTLEVSVGSILSDIEVNITGNPSGVTLNLAMYDIGSAGATTSNAPGGSAGNASLVADTGSNGYAPAQTAPYGVASTTYGPGGNGTTSSGGHYITASSNRLVAADSTNIALPGYSTTGTTDATYDFQMSGADAISLLAGEEYVVEISNVTNGSGVFFLRNADTTSEYPYGQAFKGQQAINGNNNRDFAVALGGTPVPEPATAATLGLVCASSLLVRRRRRT